MRVRASQELDREQSRQSQVSHEARASHQERRVLLPLHALAHVAPGQGTDPASKELERAAPAPAASASRINAERRSGDSGRDVTVTPSGRSASATAFAIAPPQPELPPSPTPLTPSGFSGVGVSSRIRVTVRCGHLHRRRHQIVHEGGASGWPCSSYTSSSKSAPPMPCASAPTSCPSTIMGLTARPMSYAMAYRRIVTHAGPDVHLDHRRVGAIRIRHLRRLEEVRGVEAGLHAGRPGHRRARQLPKRHGPGRQATHVHRPRLDDEILGGGFEQPGGDAEDLRADLPRGLQRGGQRDRRAAAREAADAERHLRAVAVDHRDRLGIDAQLVGARPGPASSRSPARPRRRPNTRPRGRSHRPRRARIPKGRARPSRRGTRRRCRCSGPRARASACSARAAS